MTSNRPELDQESPRGPVRRDNYEAALALAKARLREIDFSAQCKLAGAEVIETEAGGEMIARLKFIGCDYLVSFPAGDIHAEDSGQAALTWEQIVILHYLVRANGAPETGELISYQQIPDGWLYYTNFVRRTSGILTRVLGDDPQKFISIAASIGGVPSRLGKYAMEIRALPHASFHFIMWPGDDEFDTEFNCVFDRVLTEFLPTEDITVLANMIAVKLSKVASGGGQ